MDEAHRRLEEKNFARRFACFTLDDGYRDNRDHALPVFREFDAPCTVYAVSSTTPRTRIARPTSKAGTRSPGWPCCG